MISLLILRQLVQVFNVIVLFLLWYKVSPSLCFALAAISLATIILNWVITKESEKIWFDYLTKLSIKNKEGSKIGGNA